MKLGMIWWPAKAGSKPAGSRIQRDSRDCGRRVQRGPASDESGGKYGAAISSLDGPDHRNPTTEEPWVTRNVAIGEKLDIDHTWLADC